MPTLSVGRISKAGNRLVRGVTLIEMLVVVTIIGLFVAIAGQRLIPRVDQARVTAAQTQIHNLMGALNTYNLDNGTFPTTEQGLIALRVKPQDVNQWKGPYLETEIPKDPWLHDYVYQFPGEHGDGPDVLSLGKDGRLGGDGLNADIVSWKSQ